ncbi:MAG: hypothetical protein AB1Z65_10945, partial [Candidatus Sulfomarinibacteraceae bacterium]
SPSSLVEFLVQDLPEERAARQRSAAELASLVGSSRDPHIRDELFMELTQRIGFSADVLRDLARRMSGGRGPDRAPAPRTSLGAGELLLARIILDGSDDWRRLIAREVAPVHRSDPRLGRLICELQRFTRDESSRGTDFVRWLQEEQGAAGDEESADLMVFVAEVSTAAGPELTDDAIRMQLQRVLLEQWKAQARDLTAEIRRAEDRGDLTKVARLQQEMRELRSRRPGF